MYLFKSLISLSRVLSFIFWLCLFLFILSLKIFFSFGNGIFPKYRQNGFYCYLLFTYIIQESFKIVIFQVSENENLLISFRELLSLEFQNTLI